MSGESTVVIHFISDKEERFESITFNGIKVDGDFVFIQTGRNTTVALPSRIIHRITITHYEGRSY